MNNLDNLISAYCIALSDKKDFDYLFMNDTTIGGANKEYGNHDDKSKSSSCLKQWNYRQGVVGFTIDSIFLKY